MGRVPGSTLAAVAVTACASAPPRLVPRPSVTTASLRGICAVSGDVAWASGSRGTVLVTSDGGDTWRRCPVPGAETLDFRDVHAVDAQRAWLLTAGQPARIYATSDGGATWIVQHEEHGEGAFLDGFAWWGDGAGVAISDPVGGRFLVLRTADGARWTPLPGDALPVPRAGEAAFAASGTCIAVSGDRLVWIATGGGSSRVLRSQDRGATWSAVDAPLVQGTPSQGVFSLAFREAQVGVAVGGDYTQPELAERNAAFTRDGGATWSLADVSPRGYRSAVAYAPGSTWWVAVGPGGCDRSRDDGRTWHAFSDAGFHAIAFAPQGGVGFAVGAEGRIARIEVDRR